MSFAYLFNTESTELYISSCTMTATRFTYSLFSAFVFKLKKSKKGTLNPKLNNMKNINAIDVNFW